MTALRSERLAAERIVRLDPAVAIACEGAIRDVVRRDVAFARKPHSENGDDMTADQVAALIRRVAGASLDEIDRVVIELRNVREMLRNEGERVQREVAGYGSLSHAALTAMKIIADSLEQWKPRAQINARTIDAG